MSKRSAVLGGFRAVINFVIQKTAIEFLENGEVRGAMFRVVVTIGFDAT